MDAIRPLSFPDPGQQATIRVLSGALDGALFELDAFLDLRKHGASAAAAAAVNDAAIVSALAELAAAGGGCLWVREFFSISAEVNVPGNVLILGCGHATGFHMEAADTQMFRVIQVNNVGFQRLHLTGQGGYTTPGLGAIRLGTGAAGNGTEGSWVKDCWIDGVSNCGVTVGNQSLRCRVESCLIDGAGEEGIYLLGSDCLVRGNVSRENGESGIKVSVSSGSVVSGNIFKANGQHGILAAGASPSGATATIVEANQVTENAFDGIRVADGAGEIKIRGNRVVGNGQDADNTRDNIHILGTTNVECEVVGNTCRKGSGAIRARYGLNVEASASSTLVGPNDLRGGGQTADYLNNGTGTVGPTFEAGATVERGLVVNDIGSNVDARFEGDTDQNLLLVKGSTDRIGVGLSDPNFKVEIKQAGASPGIGIREVSGANFRAGFGLGLNAALTAGWIVGQSIGQNTTRDFFLFDAAAVATRLLIDPSGRIGVGTTAPNAAALLDLTSTNKGLLLPRMTTAQQDAISSPPDGLLIYNATTAKARVRAGGAWVDLH